MTDVLFGGHGAPLGSVGTAEMYADGSSRVCTLIYPVFVSVPIDTPTLKMRHDSGSNQDVQIEVYDDAAFSSLYDSTTDLNVAPIATHSWTMAVAIAAGTTYYWRARAGDNSTSTWGAWSASASFEYNDGQSIYEHVWANLGESNSASPVGYETVWANLGASPTVQEEAYEWAWANVGSAIEISGNGYEQIWGDVNEDDTFPVLWGVKPLSGRPYDGFVIYAWGVGDLQETYSSHVYMNIDDVITELPVIAWQTFPADPPMYGPDRELDIDAGIIDPQHTEIEVTIPGDAHPPSHLIWVELTNDATPYEEPSGGAGGGGGGGGGSTGGGSSSGGSGGSTGGTGGAGGPTGGTGGGTGTGGSTGGGTTVPSSPKRVFAHYVPWYPVSVENADPTTDYYARNWLAPTGEGGKHQAYGGLLRDRPKPRARRTETDWKIRDLMDEIGYAQSAGIDGFIMDIPTHSQSTDQNVYLRQDDVLTAADRVGNFKIVLMPDMTSGVGGRTYQQLAQQMASYASHSSVYKLGDGSLVIMPYKAEAQTVDFWTSFIDEMDTVYGFTVALVACFLDFDAYKTAFDPICYGMAHWGYRSPAANNVATGVARVGAAHALGQIWCQPVSVQDERPNQHIYDEARNLQNLRDTFQIAIDGDADWIQLVTWNDYSEGTAWAPSFYHGWTFLNLAGYYATWFKSGSAPTITQDKIYLTHRKHFHADTPTFPETSLMTLRPGSSSAWNKVEAMVMLTATADVSITTSAGTTTSSLGAGIHFLTADLKAGPVTAKIERSSVLVASADTGVTVTTPPYVQDLQYVGAWGQPSSGGYDTVMFEDTFSGTAVDQSKWNIRTDTQSNHSGRNFAKAVTVSGGALHIRSGTDNTIDPGSKPWVSGYLDTIGKFSLENGQWEIRCKYPWGSTAHGFWPAFWLRPDGGGDGEIDIFEGWPAQNDVHATLHHDYVVTIPHVESSHKGSPTFDPTAYHIYTLQKDVGEMRFYVDGALWWTKNTGNLAWYAAIFDAGRKWNIRLQLQIGGSYGGDPDGSTILSQTYDVDYVRVTKK